MTRLPGRPARQVLALFEGSITWATVEVIVVNVFKNDTISTLIMIVIMIITAVALIAVIVNCNVKNKVLIVVMIVMVLINSIVGIVMKLP